MDTGPVLALEPLSMIMPGKSVPASSSRGEATDTPALCSIHSRSSLWEKIVSHEIEFSFLGGSHDTHTCDVGYRRSEGDVA
jgi:hypothetical protein